MDSIYNVPIYDQGKLKIINSCVYGQLKKVDIKINLKMNAATVLC